LQIRGGFRDGVQRDIRRGDMNASRAKLTADGAADVSASACHDGYAIIEWHGSIPLLFFADRFYCSKLLSYVSRLL
jgi:hypothetical protein